ncbi:MAG: alpha/beta hydrolase [Candidatus Marinimicrobia bacterium]|nr:alpha/beta hydrolase [Candidatus Neomarinimicrobiota bacterium]
MHLQINKYRQLTIIFTLMLLFACAGNTPGKSIGDGRDDGQYTQIDVEAFGEGTEIRSAGNLLMDNPSGLLEITKSDQTNDSVLVVAVHGYESQGYEWITGLKNLVDRYGSVFFYRYDWTSCPDDIALNLASEILMAKKEGGYKKIILFGHSYGGIVVTMAASMLEKENAEIHVIAAPLSGFPKLLDNCENLIYGDNDKLKYPSWDPSVTVFQYKTVHAQDGAFRELASDPQEIDLPFYQIQNLPPTMDGHRLGHNWSVTWVLDSHIGKPHRY